MPLSSTLQLRCSSTLMQRISQRAKDYDMSVATYVRRALAIAFVLPDDKHHALQMLAESDNYDLIMDEILTLGIQAREARKLEHK